MNSLIKKTIAVVGLLCCFFSTQATMNGGTSGILGKLIVEIRVEGQTVPTADPSDFIFVAEIVGKRDSTDLGYNNPVTKNEIKIMGGRLVIVIDMQGFKNPITTTVDEIKIDVKQLSTNISGSLRILPGTYAPTGSTSFINDKGIDLISFPIISINDISFTESGAEAFTATLSGVPADYAAKGYRVEWGNSGIITGMSRSRDPYQVTGVLSDSFRASSGDLKVRLMKDTVVVAESSLLAQSDPILVANKTICSGDADRTIEAAVSSWGTGYRIRWTDDAWHVDPGLIITGNTTVRVSDDYPVGEHILWAFLLNSTGNIIGSTTFTLTILQGPVADITDIQGCVSPGERFTLSATASDNCTYYWDYENAARSGLTDLTISGVMGDKDLQYVLQVTDKSSGCVSIDTSIVRSGPAAPVVTIDTNTNRNDIKIHWNEVSDATGYRVVSRLWDGYAVVAGYGERAMITDKKNTAFTLEPSQMDTLEFFYIQSVKGQCYSKSSDTVGYMRQVASNLQDTSNSMNYISYPFDMSSKGIVTNFDLGEYLGVDTYGKMMVYSFSNFIFNSQQWEPVVYVQGKWSGKSIDLVPGSVYRVVLNRGVNSVDLLTYGKLLPKFSYNFYKKSEINTSINFCITPLNFIKDNKRQLIGNTIPNVANVSIFDFSKQVFSIAAFVSGLQRWVPTVEKDTITVKPWSPLRVVVLEDILNWTK